MLEATLTALAQLRGTDAMALSQGLSSHNAEACLSQAIRPLTREGLSAAVHAAGELPASIAIVVPAGVFTTPIEWTAIAVAAGCRVHLKAPAADPALCRSMAAAFREAGAPVTWSTDRELPPVDAIVAFGADSTVDTIARAHPDTPMARYGHRFSLAFVGGDPSAAAGPLAADIACYDGRGCMAPAAVFTTGDPVLLAESLAPQMTSTQQRAPRGTVDGALGPEWRRRLGLAKITGQVWTGAQWAVTVSPAEHFVPVALPRMVNIHSIESHGALQVLLAPWEAWLSTLGSDTPSLSLAGVHRVCRLGWMQAPSIPREHDGQIMLGGLTR